MIDSSPIEASRAAKPGRRAVIMAAGVVLLAAIGAAVLWRVSSHPEPAQLRALRANEPGATESAEAALSSIPRGTCAEAGSVDLGPLAELGPWGKVCVWGSPDGSARGIEFKRPEGDSEIEFTDTSAAPIQPMRCLRHVTGEWWGVAPPNLNDPMSPCPSGFTFQGG